jgi:trk system potassium uptake protein TrkH
MGLFLSGVASAPVAIPLLIALVRNETAMFMPFAVPLALSVAMAVPSYLYLRGRKPSLALRDAYLLVFIIWVVVCFLGSLPYLLSGEFSSAGAAFFESVSGFTTTGSSMLSDVEASPQSLVFWRGLTHWLGGMGIVVLTVALLPALGFSGFELMQAESPGPEADRIVPRVSRTAKILWGTYVALTAVELLLLKLGGMPWFDAVFNSFSTMGTGGFSCRNDSIASYNSPYSEWVITVFMFIAAMNFSLISAAVMRKWRTIYNNSEFRAYLLIVLIAVALGTLSLVRQDGDAAGASLRRTAFHAVSTLSTTGFSVTDQSLWPPLSQAVLFFLMLIGGCSGSTAGGVKVIRWLILWKQSGNEMKKLIHPKGVFPIRLDNAEGKKSVVYGTAGFVFVYLFLVVIGFIVAASGGLDLHLSLNLSLITLGNIGMGLGPMDAVCQALPEWQKWFFSLIMLIGRLELWCVLIFFSRDYWRR